jgi:hypothetical protein
MEHEHLRTILANLREDVVGRSFGKFRIVGVEPMFSVRQLESIIESDTGELRTE